MLCDYGEVVLTWTFSAEDFVECGFLVKIHRKCTIIAFQLFGVRCVPCDWVGGRNQDMYVCSANGEHVDSQEGVFSSTHNIAKTNATHC